MYWTQPGKGWEKGLLDSENKFVLQTIFCFDLQHPLNNFSCIRKTCPCPSENMTYTYLNYLWFFLSPPHNWLHLLKLQTRSASQNWSIKGRMKFWFFWGPEKLSLCSRCLPSQWFPRKEIMHQDRVPVMDQDTLILMLHIKQNKMSLVSSLVPEAGKRDTQRKEKV